MRLPSLSLTRPLLAWLRADPQWARLDWRVRAALAWKAGWGSLNARLSEAQAVAPSQPLAPLLILGPWRSGTTVMHELLSAATGWATPLTWQCMDPTAFQLGSAPRRDATVARPMDGLALGSLSPQEDEFALLALGAPSAYRAFWMPHRIAELGQTLDPQYWLDQDGWLAPWESFLHAVQAKASSGPGLILKSPNHSFRARAILRRFPQSKIVWMLRDPVATFHSNRKMWRQMFAAHGLSAAADGALDSFLAQALTACAEELDWARHSLPAGQFSCCTQEDLHLQPTTQVRRVLAELGLDEHCRTADLQAAIERSRSGRVEVYTEPLPEAASAAVAALAAAQARALASL